MLKDSQTAKDVSVARRLIRQMLESLDRIDASISSDDKDSLIQELFVYEKLAERTVNNARLLPVATGIPRVSDKINEIIIEENNVNITYTEEGWFYIMLPSLLPKKEKGDASYIRATLHSAFAQYFKSHPKIKFREDMVIIFKHNYSRERTYRDYRDHDNIELNVVVDMIALYVLVDDSPMKLKHYYCSSVDEQDNTEIFLVPYKDFPMWLERHNV